MNPAFQEIPFDPLSASDDLWRRYHVFRRARCEFLEGERQLVDKPRRAFRFLAVNLSFELRDPQLLLRDQRGIFRSFRPRHRQLRFQGGVFCGKSVASGIHETKRITVFVICGAPKCTGIHIFSLIPLASGATSAADCPS